MSEIHQQALASIYRQVLQRLVNAHGEAQRQAMLRLAEWLGRRFPQLEQARLVVMCSGDRDGLLTMALLRGAQLLLAEAQGQTFRLRVAVPLHPGMSTVDHGNVQRACAALFLHEDERVEVLAVDGTALHPYDRAEPGRVAQVGTAKALLGSVHAGPAGIGLEREHCIIGTARLLLLALEGSQRSNVLVMAQPLASLLRQYARARRLLRKAGGLGPGERHPVPAWLHRVAGLLEGASPRQPPEQALATPLNVQAFLSTSPKVRWEQAMQCLGMQLDPFSLRRDALDCRDYLLGAYLSALAAKYLKGEDAASGLVEWLRPRFDRLRKEGVPVRKLAGLRAACLGERAIDSQAYRLQLHTEERYGMNEEQLCCLIFKPFVGRGAGLKAFLECCHPDRLLRESQLRQALEGQIGSAEAVGWLQRVSGLPLPMLRQLYASVAKGSGQHGRPGAVLPGPCSCHAAPLAGRTTHGLGSARQGQSTKGAGHG